MDLWSEYDNNLQLPPESAAVHGKPRRLTERVILSLVREWLLQDYASSYCRSLAATRIFRRCYWLDGLGLDARSTKIAASLELATVAPKSKKKAAGPISPVLQPVTTLAEQLAQESKPIAFYGLLLQDGSSKQRPRRKSSASTQNGSTPDHEYVVPKENAVLRTSWLEVAPQLLREIEQAPAIFLLNPFGPTLFSADDLALLYQRTVPTELCLLASHKQLETQLRTARRTTAQGAILTGLLRSDRWKTLSLEEGELTASIEKLLELFTAAMQRHFQLPVQRIVLPLQVRLAHIETVPYTLIFATRRQDSLFCMNDAVCLQRRNLYEQSHHGVLGEEWFVHQAAARQQAERELLQQRILQQGRAQRLRRWPDLRQQLMLASFGQFMLSEYDRALLELLANGQVRCEWRQRVQSPDLPRIPGNDDALLWP